MSSCSVVREMGMESQYHSLHSISYQSFAVRHVQLLLNLCVKMLQI